MEANAAILASPRVEGGAIGKSELVWKAGYGPAMLNMALSDERESDVCEELKKTYEFTKKGAGELQISF